MWTAITARRGRRLVTSASHLSPPFYLDNIEYYVDSCLIIIIIVERMRGWRLCQLSENESKQNSVKGFVLTYPQYLCGYGEFVSPTPDPVVLLWWIDLRLPQLSNVLKLDRTQHSSFTLDFLYCSLVLEYFLLRYFYSPVWGSLQFALTAVYHFLLFVLRHSRIRPRFHRRRIWNFDIKVCFMTQFTRKT